MLHGFCCCTMTHRFEWILIAKTFRFINIIDIIIIIIIIIIIVVVIVAIVDNIFKYNRYTLTNTYYCLYINFRSSSRLNLIYLTLLFVKTNQE